MIDIKSILNSWIGTPFKQGFGVKGIGTDCPHLISNIIQEINNELPLDYLPSFSHGQEFKNPENILLKYYPNCKLINSYINGCIIFYKVGNNYTMGFYWKNYVLMINQNIGVHYKNINDPVLKKIEYRKYLPIYKR